jgi:hypothetical protein
VRLDDVDGRDAPKRYVQLLHHPTVFLRGHFATELCNEKAQLFQSSARVSYILIFEPPYAPPGGHYRLWVSPPMTLGRQMCRVARFIQGTGRGPVRTRNEAPYIILWRYLFLEKGSDGTVFG